MITITMAPNNNGNCCCVLIFINPPVDSVRSMIELDSLQAPKP